MGFSTSSESDVCETEGVLYRAVAVKTIVADVPISFSLFTQIGDKHVIYVRPGERLDGERRDQLNSFDQDILFVREAEHELYLQYLEGQIVRLLEIGADEEERLAFDRYFDTSVTVVRNMLQPEISDRSIALAGQLVESSLETLDQPRRILGYLSTRMDICPDLYAHSLQVSVYGLSLARMSGFPSDQLSDLGIGLLLHDIGKLQLPQELLDKEGPLTESEWRQVREHPEVGLALVSRHNWCSPVIADVVAHHHVRLDGSGYPQQEHPEELSLPARIAAIVNRYDSQVNARGYRSGRRSFEVLRSMIQEERGAYDAKLLANFVRLLAP